MTSGLTGVTGDAVVVLITAALLTGMLIVNTLVVGSGCDSGSGLDLGLGLCLGGQCSCLLELCDGSAHNLSQCWVLEILGSTLALVASARHDVDALGVGREAVHCDGASIADCDWCSDHGDVISIRTVLEQKAHS